MGYIQFERDLLVAIVEAADSTSRGQVEVFPIADSVRSHVDERWVVDAVRSYESDDLVFNVSRRLGPSRDGGGITLMITGKGRRTAEAFKAQIAQVSPPTRKIGY